MATLDTLTTRFEADIIKFEEAMKRMQRSTSHATDRIRREHSRASTDTERVWARANIGGALQNNIRRGISGVQADLVRLSGAMAAAFSVQGAVAAADAYTRFTNSLRVAGLEGAALAEVQDRLFASAQRNGTQLEPLSQLYGRAAQSAGELGATQEQLLQFTDGVTNALRIQGATTESAQGALLQLAQALGSGVVRAEEFNSVNEGARPVLEAVALGSDRFGGSVTRLRNAILDGTVTSREFFQAFLAGSASLEERAARAVPTVAQAVTTLQNALVEAIGKTDQSLGITTRLAQAITFLADNLDKVAGAVVIVSSAIAARFIPGMVAAGVASMRLAAFQATMTASLMGTSAAAMMASRALAFFGGPVGLAIMAVGAALGFLAMKGVEASAATAELDAETRALAEQQAAADRAAEDAAIQTGNLSEEQWNALEATAALTGRVDLLTSAYGRMALRAWEAARAAAAASLAEARANRRRYETQAASAYDQRFRRARGPIASADGRQPLPRGLEEIAGTFASEDPTYRAAQRDAQVWARAEREAQAELDRVNADARRPGGVESYNRTTGGGGGGDRGRRSGGGRPGPSAEDIARADARALHDAEVARRAATLANTYVLSERHRLELEGLDAQHVRNVVEIQQDEQTSAATKARLVALENDRHAQERAAMLREQSVALAEQEIERDRARAQRDEDIGRAEDQLYQEQIAGARNERERWALEAAWLAARQRREIALADAELRELNARLRIATTDEEIADLREQIAAAERRRATLSQTHDQQTRNQGQEQKSETDRWFDEFSPDRLEDRLNEIRFGALQSLEDGLLDVIDGTKSLGEVWEDVANQIIREIMRIVVRQYLLKPLYDWMNGGSKGAPGGGGGNTFGTILNVIGSWFGGGHAAGTAFAPGGISLVGEKGPELVTLPQGAGVMPYSTLRTAMNGRGLANAGRNGTVILSTTVNANDAVLTSTVQSWIYQSQIRAVEAARKMVAIDQAKRSMNSLMR